MFRKCLFVALLCLSFGCTTPDIRDSYIPTEYEITKAKTVYRDTHPKCEVCGAKSNITNGNQNPVHHRIPVHVSPELAATQSNLVTLCRRHHFWIGHCGNYRAYNERLNETIEAVRKAYEKNAKKVSK